MNVLAWHVSWALLAVAGLFDLAGADLIRQGRVEGYFLVAAGIGLKAATMYLLEKGIITKLKEE